MSRTLARIDGTGAGGQFTAPEPWRSALHGQRVRNAVDLLLLGQFRTDVGVGGSLDVGVDASATGDVDLAPTWTPIRVDNTGSQLSGFTDANGASLVVQLRFYVRVSNGAITVTPKVVYGTDGITFGSTATITGQLACAATSDAYTGTNQLQTVALTLPAGVKYFKPRLTIAGTPAAGYQVWGRALYDCYVQST